jgi:hypothetical protein
MLMTVMLQVFNAQWNYVLAMLSAFQQLLPDFGPRTSQQH